MRITTKDLGKYCFLWLQMEDGTYRWENTGAKIAGDEMNGLVLIKTPESDLCNVPASNVRVLEPRPQRAY